MSLEQDINEVKSQLEIESLVTEIQVLARSESSCDRSVLKEKQDRFWSWLDSHANLNEGDHEQVLPREMGWMMHKEPKVTQGVFWYNLYSKKLDYVPKFYDGQSSTDHSEFKDYRYEYHSKPHIWIRGRYGILNGKEFVMIYPADFPQKKVTPQWAEDILKAVSKKENKEIYLLVDEMGQKLTEMKV